MERARKFAAAQPVDKVDLVVGHAPVHGFGSLPGTREPAHFTFQSRGWRTTRRTDPFARAFLERSSEGRAIDPVPACVVVAGPIPHLIELVEVAHFLRKMPPARVELASPGYEAWAQVPLTEAY